MTKCKICKDRNIASLELKASHIDLCHSCAVVDDCLEASEIVLQNKAPKGKTIVIEWKYIDAV